MSFSHWMYLAKLKLPSILTFLSHHFFFMHLQCIQLDCFARVKRGFSLFGRLSINSYLLKCSSILISWLNRILFRSFPSIRCTSCTLKIRVDFWDAAFWNSEFQGYWSLVHIFLHLHYLFLKIFTMILDVKFSLYLRQNRCVKRFTY